MPGKDYADEYSQYVQWHNQTSTAIIYHISQQQDFAEAYINIKYFRFFVNLKMRIAKY